MARKQVITCDVCGVERKEANHWLVAIPLNSGEQLGISKWDFGNMAPEAKHLCGQECTHKLLDEFLSK